MKILHTSDWHLGQNFFTKSRKNEHQAFIHWLLELIKAQQIDAVIIAGDIFDTGTPPSYAREMYNQFVVKLSQLGTTLIVLGGNHDSVSMLNESKDLLACLNTHVIANTTENLKQYLLGSLRIAQSTQSKDIDSFIRVQEIKRDIEQRQSKIDTYQAQMDKQIAALETQASEQPNNLTDATFDNSLSQQYVTASTFSILLQSYIETALLRAIWYPSTVVHVRIIVKISSVKH